ncbi:MAG: hypothetical protein AUJ07_08695 [Crenarchaeota archaeon 13_1_40CM_3_53_5]|nr:MAG: hypothetical protein AUJ07_08695 [Crenarchaeota archaeon 13_1_40CM_3_53_5]
MLGDNVTEPWPVQEFSPSGTQLGSNSGVFVGSIDSKTKKRQISLGSLPSTPSMPLRQNFFIEVGYNVSSPGLLGKDFLAVAGPTTFPERFEKSLHMVAFAYNSVRARLENDSVQFNASLEVSRDPDQLDSESLLVVIRVTQMPYRDMLKLWNGLSFAFAEKLDKSLIGNVHLVLRPGD